MSERGRTLSDRGSDLRQAVLFDKAGEPGDAQAFHRALEAAAERNSPWAWLERERSTAERTLAAIEAGESGEDGDRVLEPWHGSGWFSQEIVQRIEEIERARERGDLEQACRCSAELGELATAIRMKVAWDANLETGIKQRDSLDDFRGAANAQRQSAAAERHAIWQAEAEKVWENRPSLSTSRVAALVKKELKEAASERTIRGAIRKLAEPG